MKKILLVLAAGMAATVIGCMDETTSGSSASSSANGTGGGGGAASSSASSSGAGGEGSPCTRTYDPQSGAENSGCTAAAPACASGTCGDDHLCHVHDFPIGTPCSDTETCDGMGTCKSLAIQCTGGCDDALECTADTCQLDKGTCLHESYPRTHICGGTAGHCNPDDGSCCAGGFVPDSMAPSGFTCVAACPVEHVANPDTGICTPVP